MCLFDTLLSPGGGLYNVYYTVLYHFEGFQPSPMSIFLSSDSISLDGSGSTGRLSRFMEFAIDTLRHPLANGRGHISSSFHLSPHPRHVASWPYQAMISITNAWSFLHVGQCCGSTVRWITEGRQMWI